MAISILIGAWLAGALGGVHCIAMCAAFIAATSARDGVPRVDGAVPLLPARSIIRRQLGYQAGRIATYMLLGAAFGAAGAVALQAADLLPVQRVLYVIANVFLLILASSLATRSAGIAWLQRIGGTAFGAALPMLRPLLRHPGLAGRIALGLAWGLVPCALVYSVLPLALFSGGAWQGALVMLAFGLGTLPNLAVTGLLIARTKALFERTALRFAAAALLSGFAAVGIYQALYAPGALARGPFCLMP
jgi:sulfite exporter TauE/SafE